jgi:regulatory protein
MSERDRSPPDAVPAAPATAPAKRSGGRGGFTLSLKGRALRLLTGREHSRAELERKLAPHEGTPGELAAVLDKLAAKDLQSEQRAVDSLVHRRSAKLGSARIRTELTSI